MSEAESDRGRQGHLLQADGGDSCKVTNRALENDPHKTPCFLTISDTTTERQND